MNINLLMAGKEEFADDKKILEEVKGLMMKIEKICKEISLHEETIQFLKEIVMISEILKCENGEKTLNKYGLDDAKLSLHYKFIHLLESQNTEKNPLINLFKAVQSIYYQVPNFQNPMYLVILRILRQRHYN